MTLSLNIKILTWISFVMALSATVLVESGRADSGPPQSETLQNIMDNYIDPSADTLWDSVGTIQTAGKTQAKQPDTDAAWHSLREFAVKLIAGAELLGKVKEVGENGHGALADASTPGIRSAVQIKQDIKSDPARFKKAADRLRLAAIDALNAIDAKKPDALIEAGAKMDAACEACHSAYWYPRTPPMTLLSPDEFGRIASRP